MTRLRPLAPLIGRRLHLAVSGEHRSLCGHVAFGFIQYQPVADVDCARCLLIARLRGWYNANA